MPQNHKSRKLAIRQYNSYLAKEIVCFKAGRPRFPLSRRLPYFRGKSILHQIFAISLRFDVLGSCKVTLHLTVKMVTSDIKYDLNFTGIAGARACVTPDRVARGIIAAALIHHAVLPDGKI